MGAYLVALESVDRLYMLTRGRGLSGRVVFGAGARRDLGHEEGTGRRKTESGERCPTSFVKYLLHSIRGGAHQLLSP